MGKGAAIAAIWDLGTVTGEDIVVSEYLGQGPCEHNEG